MAARKYNGPKELAALRHRKSKLLRVASIVAVLIPICFFLSTGINTPIWIVCLFLAVARFLYLEFKSMREAAVRAEKGGQAEDRVADLLSTLKDSGWKIEQNVLLPREGDVDFVVTSPNQIVIAVEVKSHGGIITESDRELLRNDKPLERDVIASVRRQAVLVSSQKGCGIVVPVIAFTRAKLQLSDETVDGVYVTKSNRLIDLLFRIAGLPNPDAER